MLVLLLGPASLAAKDNLQYVDAATLPQVNRPCAATRPYDRLDTDKYPDMSERAVLFYQFPTGIALRFRTDSRNIAARWFTSDTLSRVNTQSNAQKGLDLYIMRDGRWLHAGVGTPKYRGKRHAAPIVSNMDPGTKECLLYLPIFARLDSLAIGIDPGSSIEASELDDFAGKPRIVAMGSSITHGVGVSRAGMAWPALLGRRLGAEVANLGTSGISKLEPFFADIIADTKADVFVFDVFSNPSAKEIHERLATFVSIIRKAHPTTPLIFLQTEIRETTNFDNAKREFESAKRRAAREEMTRLMASDPNIYFLDPGLPLGSDHEATADGVHPTDLGTMRIVNTIATEILR